MRKDGQLTTKQVENAGPGWHPDGGNLFLQVTESGAKSWILRYTLKGRTRDMGLGSERIFALAETRKRARAARQLLADGIDPIDHRDALRARQTAEKANSKRFDWCAAEYIKAHSPGWKNSKHIDQWKNTLKTYASPILGALPVQEIETPHIMRVLEPIWNTKPETATRLRGRIEQVLDWAKVHKYRSGENPARWRGHIDKLLPKKSKVHTVTHLAALPYQDMDPFMEALRQQPGIAARAVEFTILTTARSGTVRLAGPKEIELAEAIWTAPAEHMKGKKEHRTPLSPRALEIIRERLKADDKAKYLFPNERNGKPLSDMALTAVLRRMGRNGITVHGFRSSFRDWAAERTDYPGQMCEFALAHALPSEVEAAYLRTDMLEKRRQLMKDWARFCDTPKQTGKVLPMKKRGKPTP